LKNRDFAKESNVKITLKTDHLCERAYSSPVRFKAEEIVDGVFVGVYSGGAIIKTIKHGFLYFPWKYVEIEEK
jgi:hypothetical protein